MGAAFQADLNGAFERIAAMLQAYAGIGDGLRRALLKKHPYRVIFSIERERVVVIAIFHRSRDPRTLSEAVQRRLGSS